MTGKQETGSDFYRREVLEKKKKKQTFRTELKVGSSNLKGKLMWTWRLISYYDKIHEDKAPKRNAHHTNWHENIYWTTKFVFLYVC